MATLVVTGKIMASHAAFFVLIALTTNTLTKSVLAMATGSSGFAWRVLAGLTLMILAAWLGWWLNWSHAFVENVLPADGP